MDSKIKLFRIALQAFLIGILLSSCSNPYMHKIGVEWGYTSWDELLIDGFELFVGYKNGDYNELIEINKSKRKYEFKYLVEPEQNVHMALVAYYDIPVGKKKVRIRSTPVKTSMYPNPPENIRVEIIPKSKEWI